MKKQKLSQRQKKFIAEYPKDCNGTQAAIRSGYAKESANVAGSRLLANDNISKPIKEKLQSLADKVGISTEYVLQGLKEVSERCRQAEQVLDREGNPTGEYKFDSSGANKSLELLGKHLKIFGDEKEININFVIDFSTKVVEVLNKTLPEKCPHCKTLLNLKSETVKELEILSQKL